MKLWLRRVWALLRASRLSRMALGDTIERRLRVWRASPWALQPFGSWVPVSEWRAR